MRHRTERASIPAVLSKGSPPALREGQGPKPPLPRRDESEAAVGSAAPRAPEAAIPRMEHATARRVSHAAKLSPPPPLRGEGEREGECGGEAEDRLRLAAAGSLARNMSPSLTPCGIRTRYTLPSAPWEEESR